MTVSKTNMAYCLDMVRRDDRERYETALFAPRSVQPKLWALYAFNQEIAKTRENVSEPALGEIRLQWWRDAIEELGEGRVRDHPVVAAMAESIRDNTVWTLLGQLIDAREQDLYDDGPADQEALENYAEAVGGSLGEAALRLSLSKEPSEDLIGQVRASGSAWAMLGLVRAIPFHWSNNRNYVPGDKGLASLATTDADKMFELAGPSIARMIAYSAAKLEACRMARTVLPPGGNHVLLSNVQLRLHLDALKAAEGNPFKAAEVNVLKKLSLMMLAAMTGRF